MQNTTLASARLTKRFIGTFNSKQQSQSLLLTAGWLNIVEKQGSKSCNGHVRDCVIWGKCIFEVKWDFFFHEISCYKTLFHISESRDKIMNLMMPTTLRLKTKVSFKKKNSKQTMKRITGFYKK